ncbi:hypothetical protein [Paenibacillus glycinis]|uniref:DUF1453 domain-containing protein n=1 Tax=Paenibacillus glycinis TaxID=2697035 RepID=A0ABW9XR38_9BACL|nr:hypothetical protein [Paenibacillus glycinis]NBD25111.1 hypothetical protein [Paenibacillus glycinis]
MKRAGRTFLVGAVLLIVGFAWALTMNGLGTLEWALLLTGIALGVLAGTIQGWAVARKRRGTTGSGKMLLWVSGTIVSLIVVKVAINILIPSNLATEESGLYLSIVFAVGGLFLGRGAYSRLAPIPGERGRKRSS